MSTSSILPIDKTLSGASTPARVDLGAMAIKRYSAFPNFWSFTVRSFCVISNTLIKGGVVLPLCRDAVGVFYSLNRLGKLLEWDVLFH